VYKRQVKHRGDRRGQVDHAQRRPQVPASPADSIDHLGADLIGKLFEIPITEVLQVRRPCNLVQ